MRTIYDVPVILRREIEALMIKPFLDAFEQELGHEKAYAIAAKVIEDLARKQGKEYAEELGGNDLDAVVRQMTPWGANGALELEFEHPDEEHMNMTVQKCVYVDMYERIGMRELGSLLSCFRDEPFYEGMNPEMKMKRTKTLMRGDDGCDFCFYLKKRKAE